MFFWSIVFSLKQQLVLSKIHLFIKLSKRFLCHLCSVIFVNSSPASLCLEGNFKYTFLYWDQRKVREFMKCNVISMEGIKNTKAILRASFHDEGTFAAFSWTDTFVCNWLIRKLDKCYHCIISTLSKGISGTCKLVWKSSDVRFRLQQGKLTPSSFCEGTLYVGICWNALVSAKRNWKWKGNEQWKLGAIVHTYFQYYEMLVRR